MAREYDVFRTKGVGGVERIGKAARQEDAEQLLNNYPKGFVETEGVAVHKKGLSDIQIEKIRRKRADEEQS